jgi:site-specific DNA recombinase
MGVMRIAVWLNEHCYRTRAGANWGLAPIHALLSHPVYGGRNRFNKAEARSGRRKAESEHVFADAPANFDPAVFAQVRACSNRATRNRDRIGPVALEPKESS